MEEITLYIQEANEQMQKTVAHTGVDFQKVRAGKANPAMLNGIFVEYYGALTPLSQIAAINTIDARTIVVKPWEKKSISDVERAIMKSDLGINPQNDGEVIRLNIPPLTEERRKDLVKQVKALSENGKVAIRNIRKDINNDLKKLQKEDNAPEDLIKKAEDDVQKMTDKYIKQIDELLAEKEKEILTI